MPKWRHQRQGVVSLTATVGRERMIPPPHIRRSEPDCLQEQADAAVAAFVVDLSAGGSPSRHGPHDPIGPMADPEISRFPRKERPYMPGS